MNFSLELCDKLGTCHETPHVPSPHTQYSARTEAQFRDWWRLHDRNKNKSEAFVAHYAKTSGAPPRPPLILLGDSITESWEGTSMGVIAKQRRGVPEVLQRMAASLKVEPLVLGISGDQTQHLL